MNNDDVARKLRTMAVDLERAATRLDKEHDPVDPFAKLRDDAECSCEYDQRVLYSIVIMSDEESVAMTGTYAQRYYAYGPKGLSKGDRVELLTKIGTWVPAFVASVKPHVPNNARVSAVRKCVVAPLSTEMKLRIATKALDQAREWISEEGLSHMVRVATVQALVDKALKDMARFD